MATASPLDVVLVPPKTSARIPGQYVRFQNLGTGTTTATYLVGGQYGITWRSTSWGGGSVQLQVLAADDITFVNAAVAATADGTSLVLIPSGYYLFVVTTSTGVSIDMTRI